MLAPDVQSIDRERAVHQAPSYNATLLLQALSRGHRYGFDIMRVTELPSGTVYPLLRRMEQSKLVRSRWEEVDASHEGRPARRFYEVTARGKQALESALLRLAVQQRLFPDLATGQKGAD